MHSAGVIEDAVGEIRLLVVLISTSFVATEIGEIRKRAEVHSGITTQSIGPRGIDLTPKRRTQL
jgi:hypothetical protein